MFSSGNTLFIGNGMLVDAGNLRDMEDDYGILPHPKFDEAQEQYRSLVHDQALLTRVSIASQNLDIGAYPPIWGASMHPFKALRSPITQDMFKTHHPIAEIPAHAALRTAAQLWWSKWWSGRIGSARW